MARPENIGKTRKNGSNERQQDDLSHEPGVGPDLRKKSLPDPPGQLPKHSSKVSVHDLFHDAAKGQAACLIPVQAVQKPLDLFHIKILQCIGILQSRLLCQGQTGKHAQEKGQGQEKPQDLLLPPHDRNTWRVSKSAWSTGALTARMDSFPNISTWVPRAENPASLQIPEANSAMYVIPTIFKSVPR